MLRLIFFLFLSIYLHAEEHETVVCPSTPEQIATYHTPTDMLIGGIVSPLGGFPALSATDLIAQGAEPIIIRRIYTSPFMPCSFDKNEEIDRFELARHLRKTYKGWQYHPHGRLIIKDNILHLTDSNGMTLEFQWPIKDKAVLKTSSYGMSNYNYEHPSAQFDPRNIEVTAQEHQITAKFPTGLTRLYTLYDYNAYFLYKEILPNGKVIRYTFQDNGLSLLIESLDPHEKYVYAKVRTQGSPYDKECTFSTGEQTVTAHYTSSVLESKFKDKRGKCRAKQSTPPVLSRVTTPGLVDKTFTYCGRLLLLEVNDPDVVFKVCHSRVSKENKYYQVGKLSFPVGKNGAFKEIYSPSYSPPIAGEQRGETIVPQVDDSRMNYWFSQALLLDRILYKDPSKKTLKQIKYTWNAQQRIESVTLCDGNEMPIYTTSYECGGLGNPVYEKKIGNFTGYNDNETREIKRSFSPDIPALPLHEQDVTIGITTRYSYLARTNLITAKILDHHGTIYKREFRSYDDCNNLIQVIIDDGTTGDPDDLTGVTQRRITTYILRQEQPFLHMPEWIIESYLEKGIEQLLRKKHLTYDVCGNIVEEAFYDSNGSLAYTIYKTYDQQHNCLTETNPIGQQACHTYDKKGRLLTTKDISGRFQTTYQYDRKGRLTSSTRTGDDQIAHTTQTTYDAFDRVTCTTDPFGQTTTRSYTLFDKQPSSTTYPSILDEHNAAVPVTTHALYDLREYPIATTDANGNTTTTEFNADGSPLKISHPDGTTETFRYSLAGDLLQHTLQDGLTLIYTRDHLGRVLTKTYTFEGATLAIESFTYNTFHLLSHTDREGNTRTFSYDGAGRKICESFAGQVTEWVYDPLGHLKTLIEDDTLYTHYKRDLLGRVLQEQKTDCSGRILSQIAFTYDLAGNIASSQTEIDGQYALKEWSYDSLNRTISYTDGDHNRTITTYDEHSQNALNQRILTTRIERPDQVVCVRTEDALHRPHLETTYSQDGIPVATKCFIHDPHGNLIYRMENDQILALTYTSTHRLSSHTQDSRTTYFTYTPRGDLATKVNPNQTILYHTYHPLGFLIEKYDSLNTFHHHFTYNRNGHLQSAIDTITGSAFHRKTDPFGKITEEILPCGIILSKTYDSLQRLLSLQIGDFGQIVYTYDPLHLRAISRLDPDGNILYTHTYATYDKSSHCLKEHPIGNLAPSTYRYSAGGLLTHLNQPGFSEEYSYDAVYNLIARTQDSNVMPFTYDARDQLFSEPNHTYQYDLNDNRIAHNDTLYITNALNELPLEQTCDPNGNPILRHTPDGSVQLSYDSLGQLTSAQSPRSAVHLTYDPLGRAASKTTSEHQEHYLYNGMTEIGAVSSHGELLNLKVLGLSSKPIAIELNGQVLAPCVDVQGNVRRLLDPLTGEVVESYDFTSFGECMTARQRCPWGFAAKRYHPELGLIDFGKRYYDPHLGRWLTPDPAGFIDSLNLYQYVWNNPLKYYDPNGESIGGYCLGLGEILLGGAILLGGFTLNVATCGGFSFGVGVTTNTGLALISMGLVTTTYHSQDCSMTSIGNRYSDSASYDYSMQRKKKGGVDDTLSTDPLNDPNLEDISHPEGKKKGHYQFKDKKTGQIIEYDQGKPGQPGHRGHDHYHRPNPKARGDRDKYLDEQGVPVPSHSEESHLYPSDWTWW